MDGIKTSLARISALHSATLHKLDDFFGRENLRVQSLFVWTDCALWSGVERAHSGAYIVGDHHFWCMVIL